MVQQMKETKAKDLGLLNAESRLPTSDKQQLPLKKTALRDLQNDNVLRPKPVGSSHFLNDRGPAMPAVKASGIKRHAPDSPTSPHGHQSPSNNANGHIVYIRRKSESEVGKSSTCEYMENDADCPPIGPFSDREQQTCQQQIQMDSKVPPFPAFAPLPMASPMIFPSGIHTVRLSQGQIGNGLSTREPNYPVVSTAAPLPVSPQGSHQNWRERYVKSEAFLRSCVNSNQEDYTQLLEASQQTCY